MAEAGHIAVTLVSPNQIHVVVTPNRKEPGAIALLLVHVVTSVLALVLDAELQEIVLRLPR
jgi:hypothetical protein